MENILEKTCTDCEEIPSKCPDCGSQIKRDTFDECVGENHLRMGIYEEQVRGKCDECGYTTAWKSIGTHLGN